MSSEPEDPVLPGHLLTTKLIAAMLMLGVIVFAVVSCLTGANNAAAVQLAARTRTVILVIIVAIPSLAMSFWVPRALSAGYRRQFSDAKRDAVPPAVWMGPFQVQMLVGLAFLEGAGFFGLVMHYLSRSPVALAIGVAMIVLMAVRFPTRSRVERWIFRQQELMEERQASV